MTKEQLEQRMKSFGKGAKINDESLFTLVMLNGFSSECQEKKAQRILDTLLLAANARMDNLRSMDNGYKGSIKATFEGNLYLLANILTSNQPIRKKLIVAIALMNSVCERLNH